MANLRVRDERILKMTVDRMGGRCIGHSAAAREGYGRSGGTAGRLKSRGAGRASRNEKKRPIRSSYRRTQGLAHETVRYLGVVSGQRPTAIDLLEEDERGELYAYGSERARRAAHSSLIASPKRAAAVR